MLIGLIDELFESHLSVIMPLYLYALINLPSLESWLTFLRDREMFRCYYMVFRKCGFGRFGSKICWVLKLVPPLNGIQCACVWTCVCVRACRRYWPTRRGYHCDYRAQQSRSVECISYVWLFLRFISSDIPIWQVVFVISSEGLFRWSRARCTLEPRWWGSPWAPLKHPFLPTSTMDLDRFFGLRTQSTETLWNTHYKMQII